MKNHVKDDVVAAIKQEKPKKSRKFRDTVLVRVDRNLKEEVKGYSKRNFQTISKIMDYAVKEYLESVKTLD